MIIISQLANRISMIRQCSRVALVIWIANRIQYRTKNHSQHRRLRKLIAIQRVTHSISIQLHNWEIIRKLTDFNNLELFKVWRCCRLRKSSKLNPVSNSSLLLVTETPNRIDTIIYCRCFQISYKDCLITFPI